MTNQVYQEYLQETEELAAKWNPCRSDSWQNDIQESAWKELIADEDSAKWAFHASRSCGEAYEKTYGEKPNMSQYAVAGKAIENVLEGRIQQAGGGQMILEADGTTTNDIPVRNIFIGMVLPSVLFSITSRLTTPFPAGPDHAEIYRLYTRADSNWNGFTPGQILDETFTGGYGNLDLYRTVATGDGSTTSWTYNIGFAVVKERVKVLIDMDAICARDDGAGNLNGTLQVNGTTISLVNSTINYQTGAVTLQTSAPVPNGLDIEVKFDTDIEYDPSLIPKIKHDISKFEVFPHESVLASQYTVQAMLNLQRNYSQNMAMIASRNLLNLITANMDRVIIAEMFKGAKGKATFDAALPSGLSTSDHYPTVATVLDGMSADMIYRNKKAGLFAMVCGIKASRFFKSMQRNGVFQLAPGYRQIPQPHFVGRFHGIEIYEDPQLPEAEGLGIAKGDDYFKTGYYSSIAVPFMPFKHSVQEDLRYKSTLYGKQYRDFAPIDGRDYFMKFEVLNF